MKPDCTHSDVTGESLDIEQTLNLRRRETPRGVSGLASDVEAEASKTLVQSASVFFTEADSGRLYLAEACQIAAS